MNAAPHLEGVRSEQRVSEPQTLTLTQVCERIQRSRWAIWRWIKAGAFPGPINRLGHPLWSVEDIQRFQSGAWGQSVARRHGSSFREARNGR